MDFLQYVDMDSILHRLDPRTKFFFFISMAVVTSLVKTGVALGFLLIVFIGIWTKCKIGKYILILLKKMKILLLFIFLVWVLMGAFSVNGGTVLFGTSFKVFNHDFVISFETIDLYKSFVLSLRIFLMISSFYTVIISTNFSQIILGLQKTKVPYSVAFGIGLVFQIIPMIIKEFTTIMEAQSSRGLEIDKCNAVDKVKNYVTVSLPLLFRVLSKGHSISLAMHYYKLNFSIKRTAYKDIHLSRNDAAFTMVTLFSIVITVYLHVRYYVPI